MPASTCLYENGTGRIGLVVAGLPGADVLFRSLQLLHAGQSPRSRHPASGRLGYRLRRPCGAVLYISRCWPGGSRSCGLALGSSVAIACRCGGGFFLFSIAPPALPNARSSYGDGPLAGPLITHSPRPELGLRVAGFVGSTPQAGRDSDCRPDDLTSSSSAKPCTASS